MHNTATDAVEFLRRFRRALSHDVSTEILLIPPFTALASLRRELQGEDTIRLGAQNMHWQPDGAYTGEISGRMLQDAGCQSVIVGHSERRRLFGETDAHVNDKLKAAVRHGLAPILCVGETLVEREAGRTEQVVHAQLIGGLRDLTHEQLAGLTIAYEPVWAIGTGQAATVREAEAVHVSIRSVLNATWPRLGTATRIIYGGSVSPDNARALFGSDEINGALVGKTCLDPEGFAKICRLASSPQVARIP